MQLTYSGRNLLITGGSSDLAVDLAKSAVEQSLFPILTWRNQEGKEFIERELAQFDGRFTTARLDLADVSTITSFAESYPHIDYLADYAQGDLESFVASASYREVEHYFAECISAKALLIKELSRMMIDKRRGRMIHISSTAAARINPGQGFYSAAKNAAEALYRTTGIELAKKGITTVTLRLGYTDAGRGKIYYGSNHIKVIETIPIARLVSVREVSDSIIFLLSDNASAFNATEITLDGGLTSSK